MRGGGGGGGRGFSGGGRGDGAAAILRRLRAVLAGDDSGGGAGGGSRGARIGRESAARGGGGGGGGPAVRASADSPPLGSADWTCGECGFTPNFARRRYCFDCGAAKANGGQRQQQPQQHARGTTARSPASGGPVGDRGRRPLLSWGRGNRDEGGRGTDEPPTRRTPGASVAAIVEEAKRGVARSGGADGGIARSPNRQAASPPARPKPAVDADGFIAVGRSGKPTAAAAAASTPSVADDLGPSDDAASARPPPPARAEQRDGGPTRGGEQCEDLDAEDDDADAPQQEPTELRRRWAEEVALVKRLSRQGLPDGHPALVAAHAARDAAEAAWREAKQPAPVVTRLRWAQAKLARALELAEATGAAIEKAEAEHEKLMSQLHDRRADDDARVRKRQQAVQELQREIGGGDPVVRASDGGSAALLEACGGLCNAVGPELAALAERMPEGSDEWHAINRVLATLMDKQRRVEEAAGLHDTPPLAFNIGDGDDDGPEDMSVASQWSESHELGSAQEPGPGGCGGGDAGMSAPHLDGGWSDWGQDRWQAAHWRADQHGRWHRSSWADQWEAEHGQAATWGSDPQAEPAQGARRGGGEHDEESGEPSAKHRRQQVSGRAAAADGTSVVAAGSEAAAAAQASAAVSTAGLSAMGTTGAADYAAQVAEVVGRAINMGVQPITEEGQDLITLSPALLAHWVSEHLEQGAGR